MADLSQGEGRASVLWEGALAWAAWEAPSTYKSALRCGLSISESGQWVLTAELPGAHSNRCWSPRPWDSPGMNTAVGCHFLLQCMKVKSESEVAQLYPTHRNPMDCSPSGSSLRGISQARALEWGAIAFSSASVGSRPFLSFIEPIFA